MKIDLKINGVHCESCAKLIESELENDVKKIKIDMKKGKAEIDFDESRISEKDVKEKIKSLGYGVD